jgi:hypothetical protein
VAKLQAWLDSNGTNPREQARKVTLRQILGDSGRPRIWINRAVTAETVSSRKLEEWVHEFHRLEKLNKDFLQQPKKRTRRASGREGDLPNPRNLRWITISLSVCCRRRRVAEVFRSATAIILGQSQDGGRALGQPKDFRGSKGRAVGLHHEYGHAKERLRNDGYFFAEHRWKSTSAAGHTGVPTSPLRTASIKQWRLAGTNKFPLRRQTNESGTPMRT